MAIEFSSDRLLLRGEIFSRCYIWRVAMKDEDGLRACGPGCCSPRSKSLQLERKCCSIALAESSEAIPSFRVAVNEMNLSYIDRGILYIYVCIYKCVYMCMFVCQKTTEFLSHCR